MCRGLRETLSFHGPAVVEAFQDEKKNSIFNITGNVLQLLRTSVSIKNSRFLGMGFYRFIRTMMLDDDNFEKSDHVDADKVLDQAEERSVEHEKTLFVNQKELIEESVITDTLGQLLSEKVVENNVLDTTDNSVNNFLSNIDQDRLYKEDAQLSKDNPQECSKERDPERLDINTSLCSETIQETINQDHHLLSNTPNPIPSSLDLQKLLAGLSPVLQADLQSAALQTTLNNPFSPNLTNAMNSTSSTTDAAVIQSELAQHRYKDSADHDPSSVIQEDALFQKFLIDEKHIMSNTAPHEFPPGSRMFIGNLTTEKVTKKDVFHIFYPYGRLGQIALKQAYGFVQFFTPEECQKAINSEQGTMIRGRKMHLEVSKPQKHKPPSSSDRKTYRVRSRSPDIRDRSPIRGRNRSRGHGNHGYGSPYDRDNKKDRYNSRDEFGKRRSPQSRYSKDRILDYSKDWNTDYCRDYSSVSPERYRDYSQRQQTDTFPLPRRYGNDVPECQIIITDDTDRSFIYFVEKIFKDEGFRIDTLFLSPRLSLSSVVQQMIIEGIMAIIFLNRQMQSQSKISIQIFDRKADSSDVKFDEYANIDVHVAVILALRKKQSILQLTNTYGLSNYNNTNLQPPSSALGTPNADLVSLIGSLDPMTLQKVIEALTQSSQQLAQKTQPVSYTASLQIPYQGTSINQVYSINHGLRSLTTPPQQSTQHVQDILGQLAKLQSQKR
ncbi:hypothetical protein PCK1_000090 [Pneumocystis canis]|nr:hypothetical protein PCK1_000090 [Pneumocystis canis]